MNASFTEKQQKRHQQYRTVKADFRCQHKRSVWLQRLYPEQDDLFSVSHEINAHNNKSKTYLWVKPNNITAEMVKLKL